MSQEKTLPFGDLPIDSFFQSIRIEYSMAVERNGGNPPTVRVKSHGQYLEIVVDPDSYEPHPLDNLMKVPVGGPSDPRPIKR